MPKLTPAQQTELLEVLLDFPGTRRPEQREALLFSLPSQITDSIDLSGDRYAAVVKLVETLEFWGQLADGRWATEVMLRNALRAAKSTQFEQRFEAIRQTFDLPAAKVQLAALPEQIVSEISYLMPVGFLDDGQRVARAVARICVPQVFDGKPRMLGSKARISRSGPAGYRAESLVTNHHVVVRALPATRRQRIDIAMQATGAQAWFDYVDVTSRIGSTRWWRSKPAISLSTMPCCGWVVLRMIRGRYPTGAIENRRRRTSCARAVRSTSFSTLQGP